MAIVVILTGRIPRALPWLAAALAFIAFLFTVYMRPNAHMEWSSGRAS